MPRKVRKQHSATDFDLNVLSSEIDLFRWFLLCYLFGKPIQSNVAISTWRLFIVKELDTPWAIAHTSNYNLVNILRSGGYTRYQHATADGLQLCMERLIDDYAGSLDLMIENSLNEDEFSKRLQQLYGVGPKIAEIFSREVEEIFARRVE